MLDYINEFISSTFTFVNIPNIHTGDIIEILIISILMYQLTKRIVDTRLFTVAKGILILMIVYGILIITHLDVLASIFQWFMILCVICIILASQPEIKRIMESTGSKNYVKEFIGWWKRDKDSVRQLEFSNETIDALVEACDQMSKTKTGALIVIELDTTLQDIIATGIKLDALITKQLLIQIFEKNTPLHDGALVIKHDRIASATCYLPLSNNLNINKDLGTRHRAGIGVTEQADCLVLIVSEETGSISYVQNGIIKHKVSLKELRNILVKTQLRKVPVKKKHFENVRDLRVKNIKTKLIAFIGGIVIWFTVLNVIDPVTTRRISDISVDVINGNVIESTDQTYEIIDNTNISILIKGRRSIIDNINNSDIRAFADIEDMSKVYNVPININLLNGYSEYAEVTYKSKDNIKIMIDSISEKVAKVEYEQTGALLEGTYINNISTPNEVVTIKGANSVVSTIDKVVLPINVTGKIESFDVITKPLIYDRNGDQIPLDKLDISCTEFNVNVEMLNTKSVKLNIGILDSKDDSYRILEFNPEKDEITIGASDDILNELKELKIDLDITEDIQNITSNKLVKTIDIKDYISDDMVVASSNSKININIEIETPIETEVKVDVNSIEVKGLSSKYDCDLVDNKYTLVIKGYEKELTEKIIRNLIFSIDLGYSTNSAGEEDLIVDVNNKVDLGEIYFEVMSIPVVEYELSKK